jgi:hypothetical protein
VKRDVDTALAYPAVMGSVFLLALQAGVSLGLAVVAAWTDRCALRPADAVCGGCRIRSYLSVFQRRQFHHDAGHATHALGQLFADHDAGVLQRAIADPAGLDHQLAGRAISALTWQQWRNIDAENANEAPNSHAPESSSCLEPTC